MAMNIKLAALAFSLLPLAMTASAQLSPAEEGRRLYLSNNCYGCHGDVGGGSAYGAPALRGGEAEYDDLNEAIREGEDRGMPSFPLLTKTDIGNLYAYLQSLGTSTEPTFYQWWEPMPTARVVPRAARTHVAVQVRHLRKLKPIK